MKHHQGVSAAEGKGWCLESQMTRHQACGGVGRGPKATSDSVGASEEQKLENVVGMFSTEAALSC